MLLPTAKRLGETSEDCLDLNVWTAAKSSREHLPVMVYIHGGGYRDGSGSGLVFDGEALAKKGVVLVTVNYRLGIMGFFGHPELTKESDSRASGNYGLLDQMAALQWVQKNIAGFGGDRNRVTIFSQSAGSGSVLALMASPLTKGLFQRAIGESGGPPMGRNRARKEAEEAGAKLGSLADLRAKPFQDLLGSGGSGPIVDGWFLPDFTRQPPPDARIKGAAHDAELYYVFHNLNLYPQQWAEWDHRLEEIISSYWVNFATRGNPNGGNLPRWDAYSASQGDRVMLLGDKVERARVSLAKLRSFRFRRNRYLRVARTSRGQCRTKILRRTSRSTISGETPTPRIAASPS